MALVVANNEKPYAQVARDDPPIDECLLLLVKLIMEYISVKNAVMCVFPSCQPSSEISSANQGRC